MSVCGKNHVSFMGKIMSVCGKNSLDSKSHWKIPADTPEKNTRLFTSICRGTALHNVYLTENSLKLKTVYLPLPKRSPTLVPISFIGRKQFFPPTHLFNLGIHTGDWLIDFLLKYFVSFLTCRYTDVYPPSYVSCTNAVPYVSHIF